MTEEYLKYWEIAKIELQNKLKFIPRQLRKKFIKLLELTFRSGYYAKEQEKS